MEIIVKAIVTSGADGSGIGVAKTEIPVRGFLEHIEWVGTVDPVNTTTITVTEDDAAGRTVATITTGATSGVAYPRAKLVDTGGTAITNSFGKLFIAGHDLIVTLGASNHDSVYVVHFFVSGEWE